MALAKNNAAHLLLWHCPIYNRKIDEGLCWELANLDLQSLKLPKPDKIPCSIEDAEKKCRNCPRRSYWN